MGGLTSKSGASQASGNATKAGHQIYQARNQFLMPFTDQSYWNLDLPGALNQSIYYGEQQAPGLNLFNQSQLQYLLGQAVPGYQGMVGQMGANVASELQGNVPIDVQNQIQRFSAQQGITSGIGGGGGLGAAGAPFQLGVKDITARDLGLTSLSMMQQGQSGLSNLLGLAKNYLMPQPVNPLSLLPMNDIIAAKQYTQQAGYEANLAAFNASVLGSTVGELGQVPQQSQVAGLSSGIGGLLQGLGQTNPQSGQTGYQQLGGLFGGLGNLFGGGTPGVTSFSSNMPDDFAGFGVGGY